MYVVLFVIAVKINAFVIYTIANSSLFRCNYRLDGENMYSVKWYRDNAEFYRLVETDDLQMFT